MTHVPVGTFTLVVRSSVPRVGSSDVDGVYAAVRNVEAYECSGVLLVHPRGDHAGNVRVTVRVIRVVGAQF